MVRTARVCIVVIVIGAVVLYGLTGYETTLNVC